MLRPSSFLAPAALVAALVAGAPARAQQLPAAQQIPAAKTLGYLEIGDMAQAEAAFKGTDLGQSWQTLAPFFETLFKGLDAQLAEQKQQFEQEIGAKVDDVLAALKHGVAVAVVDTAPAGGQPQPMPVLMVAPAAKKTLQQLVDFQKRKAQQGGQKPPPLYIVDREGVVCLTLDQNALAVKGDAATLDKDAQYMAVRAKVVGGGTPILFAYGDIGGLLKRVEGNMPPEEKKQLDTAGAFGVKASGVAMSIDGGQTREAFFIATAEQKGVAKILATNLKSVELMKLAEKTPPDAFSFGAARFDVNAAFEQSVALAKELNPKAANDIDRQIKGANEGDLKLNADCLAPLGDLFVIETFQPDEGLLPETVFSIGVKDGPKLEATLAKIAAKANFEVAALDRGGRKIHYFKAKLGQIGQDPFTQDREMGRPVSPAEQLLTGISGSLSAWTVDGDRIYLAGLPQTLEDRFERLQKGNLASSEAFKQAAAKAQGARAFSFTTLRPTVGMTYDVVLKLLRAFEPAIRRAGVSVDTTLLPRPTTMARPIQPSTMMLFAEPDGFLFQGRGGLPILTLTPPIIAAIAIPNLIQAKKAGNEAGAIGTMRMLSTCQTLYREGDRDGNGAADWAPSLEALAKTGLIDPVLGAGEKHGYRFMITRADEAGWAAVAVPVEFGKSGDRSFYVDETGLIRFTVGEEPTAQSQPLE